MLIHMLSLREYNILILIVKVRYMAGVERKQVASQWAVPMTIHFNFYLKIYDYEGG